VIVFSAPDEERLCNLLAQADRDVFRVGGASALPLEGRKVLWQTGDARERRGA
jgi:hypothetical protein